MSSDEPSGATQPAPTSIPTVDELVTRASSASDVDASDAPPAASGAAHPTTDEIPPPCPPAGLPASAAAEPTADETPPPPPPLHPTPPGGAAQPAQQQANADIMFTPEQAATLRRTQQRVHHQIRALLRSIARDAPTQPVDADTWEPRPGEFRPSPAEREFRPRPRGAPQPASYE